jgi:hypothetical protein
MEVNIEEYYFEFNCPDNQVFNLPFNSSWDGYIHADDAFGSFEAFENLTFSASIYPEGYPLEIYGGEIYQYETDESNFEGWLHEGLNEGTVFATDVFGTNYTCSFEMEVQMAESNITLNCPDDETFYITLSETINNTGYIHADDLLGDFGAIVNATLANSIYTNDVPQINSGEVYQLATNDVDPNGFFYIGENIGTLYASDSDGNEYQCSFEVNVVVTDLGVDIACPSDIEVDSLDDISSIDFVSIAADVLAESDWDTLLPPTVTGLEIYSEYTGNTTTEESDDLVWYIGSNIIRVFAEDENGLFYGCQFEIFVNEESESSSSTGSDSSGNDESSSSSSTPLVDSAASNNVSIVFMTLLSLLVISLF